MWKGRGLKLIAALLIAAIACGTANAAPAALPDPMLDTPLVKTKSEASIVLAGGCFWGIQAVFQHIKGVTSATSGYAGGSSITAHYEIVSTGATGHAEAVKIVYDPSQITLGQILKVFFSVAHDPTELNRQGPDHGTQYRSAIFFESLEQQKIAQAYIDQLQAAKIFPAPIVTKVEPLSAFYEAEPYHQNYATLHPDNMYIVINDAPKIRALEKEFPNFYVKP